ncbi:Condensin-2 complex subunit D3 [Portunus trituberculatus]|uniref:Condensin-2 complex subunit D3 n=1 Tax=Portunus trituberculatus TaxID=210409 RepID=A0A5B7HI63_PORTR|nr:Condensin-2 complex subunit D3 [Portunus trituberculatus]
MVTDCGVSGEGSDAALSVVTLGKMCLQHEEQAKRIIPALSRLLSPSTHPAIKNNILFTLTDMCVR